MIMKNSNFNQWITLFVLMIVFALKGMASSKIGEVKIDVGTSKTVQLNSAYLNTLRNYGTRIMSFSWSTSNNNITISSQSAEQAVVKGVKPGTTQLYYKCQYVLDGYYRTFDFYYDVTISGSSVTDADINFESIFLFLDEGESYTINAIQSGVAGGVYFTTDNSQVATVKGGTRNGWKTPVTVTAVGAGITNIYANTLSGLSCSCKVTVKPLPVPATEITLPESEVLHQGQDFQLAAVISPENSTSLKTWTSDNNDVAVVSTNGLVVALAEGTANITVTTDNGLSATCCITVLPKSEPIAYAVLEQGVLTFYYDDQKDIRESTFYDENKTLIKAGGVFELGPDFSGFPSVVWTEDRVFSYIDEFGRSRDERIAGQYYTTNVVDFDPSFAFCKLESTNYLFRGLKNLNTINNIDNCNTSNVTSMNSMFSGCSSLLNLDLSSFDTSKVTSMDDMFYGCSSLASLDLSSFDTSNVTSMNSMFRDCSSLASLDLSSFDTSNVTSMYAMFSGCSSLSSIDVSSFDTSNVTSMNHMFHGCSSLSSLDLSSFNTSKVIYIDNMFYYCSSLLSLDLSSFDISNVTEIDCMFYCCSSLSSLDLSSFYTSKVTSMDDMFHGCSSLSSLDLSSFDTSNVTSMYEMFKGCSSLITILVGDGWQSNEFYGNEMFYGCKKLIGGNGTIYNSMYTGYEYAHVDGGVDNPGYLTLKNEEVETDNFITITPISVFQTFCSENSLNFSNVDGLTAYIAIGYNPSTSEVMLTPIVEVPAGTGVLLKGDVDKVYNVPICSSSNYKYNNSLVGVLHDTEITTGYVFDDSFKLVNTNTVVPANTAYLLLPDATDTGLNNVKLNMTAGSSIKGDANGDGAVDISDVVVTVNLILGN